MDDFNRIIEQKVNQQQYKSVFTNKKIKKRG
jgi:hypothetical protein